MALLSYDEVKKIVLSGVDDWIKIAREDAKVLQMHMYGSGIDEWLTQISGLENDDQLKLRKKHAISNKYMIENLLRPLDNIWSAKGGSIKLGVPTGSLEKMKAYIDDVKGGMSLKTYLKNIWRNNLISDPNGLLFIEIAPETQKAYLTQKSIFSIKNMKCAGITPEYVCFEPDMIIEQKKESSKKLVWLVDDAFYYRIQIDNEDSITIIDHIVNTFGRVPASVNSPITDTQRNIKLSPIHNQIELLNKYLTNNSVKEIYQFLHGYPIFWMYASQCKECSGTGYVDGGKCPSCGGTGHNAKKDVTDIIALKPPTEQGQPVISPNIAGYVQPDLATWREQRDELQWTWNLIYYSHWGTTVEKGTNETATGRFIDVQPVNNRLNDYADIVEKIHNNILNLLVIAYFPTVKEQSNVTYGRRYLIETPDQVWTKYMTAKKDKAPIGTLDQLYEQYVESEYQNNDMLQAYYLKLMKIEPFIHSTVDEVVNLPVSREVKQQKIYFSEWLKTKMINEIIDKPIEKSINELIKYTEVKSKTEENGREGLEGTGAED